jgi:hypothetical protein
MSEFSKAVMADVHANGTGYEQIHSDDLKRVLITGDGRGTIAKQKALDILLERAYDNGYDNGVDNERSRED